MTMNNDDVRAAAIEDLKRWIRGGKEKDDPTVADYFKKPREYNKPKYINNHVSL